MSLFNFSKIKNIILIPLTFVGVFTLFLPWIVYPRLDMTIKGYDGDGWLVSILFFLALLLNTYLFFKTKTIINRVGNILTFFLGLVIFSLGIYKIFAFYEDVNSFQSNDPITSYAGAGVYLASGLYIISIIGFLMLVVSSLGGYIKKKKHLILLFGLMLLSSLGSYLIFNQTKNSNQLDKVEIQENLDTAFAQMSNSLISGKSDQFVEYVHPILYQSIGGKGKLIELMSKLYEDVNVKSGKINKLFKTKTEGDVIQALLMQSFTFVTKGQETVSSTKSFAFSYDGGRSWIFAGIENRSYDEMKKIIPEIFDELRY